MYNRSSWLLQHTSPSQDINLTEFITEITRMSDTEQLYPESEPIMEQYNNPSSAETDHCDDDTLSFCDLPLYSSSSNSRNSDRYRQEEEDSFFEFSSDDFTAAAYPAKNIIFCGKIIPHKYPSESGSPSNAAAEDMSADYEKDTFGEFYNCSRALMPLEPEKYKSLGRISPNKKVSVLTASSSKSKWMLFMFGFAKLPYSEMELNDIKSSRQLHGASRRISTPLEEVRKRSSRNGKGCWETIKVGLGCSSMHADAVVNASFARMTHQ